MSAKLGNKLGWQTYSFVADIFGLTAWILSWIGTLRCNFLQFTSVDPGQTIVRHFGLWWYGHYAFLTTGSEAWLFEGCFAYPDFMRIDSKWTAARAFQIIVLIGGGIYAIVGAISSCALPGKVERPHAIAAVCLLVLCLFSGLTLLVLDSSLCKDNILIGELSQVAFNDQCGLATGARCVISATVFWFVAAVCSLTATRGKSEYDDETVAGTTEPLIQEEGA